jgi:hypothetical protein
VQTVEILANHFQVKLPATAAAAAMLVMKLCWTEGVATVMDLPCMNKPLQSRFWWWNKAFCSVA